MPFILRLATFVMLFSVGAVHAGDWFESSCCEVACKPCGKLTFTGDLLYWRTLQNGLDDCFCGQGVKDRWDPGIRVGLGIAPVCEGMSFDAYWTHFNNKSHHKTDDPIDGFAHWKLDYDTFDILLG